MITQSEVLTMLEAKLKEHALQMLASEGQWIEHTGQLVSECDALKAAGSEVVKRWFSKPWNKTSNDMEILNLKRAVDAAMKESAP